MTIPARYEKGVFRPLQDVPIKEGTLVEVLLPAAAPAMRPPSIADSPFAGMWKDREDMADSVEYIDRLRALGATQPVCGLQGTMGSAQTN